MSYVAVQAAAAPRISVRRRRHRALSSSNPTHFTMTQSILLLFRRRLVVPRGVASQYSPRPVGMILNLERPALQKQERPECSFFLIRPKIGGPEPPSPASTYGPESRRGRQLLAMLRCLTTTHTIIASSGSSKIFLTNRGAKVANVLQR